MSLYYGIDFGTSTNYVTKWDATKEKAISVPGMDTDSEGYGAVKNSFPNVIYYQNNGKPVIGSAAYKRYKDDPENGVYAVKRRIGEDMWSTYIPNLNKSLTAKEVSRDIFRCIKDKLIEKNAGTYIDGVVISVPYSYQNKERSIIKDAAEGAGLRVVGLIEEPVAAALSFGLFNNNIQIGKKEKVLVFDLGGGTFDITIFEFVKEQEGFKIEVLNTAGNKYLGGNDIDELLKDYLISDILKIPIEDRIPKYQSNILQVAKSEKELLSDEYEDDLFEGEAYGDKDIDCVIDRGLVETLLENTGYISKINECLEEAIYDVEGLEPEMIDKIVLVGGSSNIPIIQEKLKEFFGKEPLYTGNPDELVGEGAGIFCGIKLSSQRLNLKVIQKISYAIGVKKGMSFEPVLPKNSKYNEYSAAKYLSVSNTKSENLEIEIYQGNSRNIQNCSYAGSVSIEPSMFKDWQVGIKLGTDENGSICYQLVDSDAKIIKQGLL